jgi:hypothetical protein
MVRRMAEERFSVNRPESFVAVDSPITRRETVTFAMGSWVVLTTRPVMSCPEAKQQKQRMERTTDFAKCFIKRLPEVFDGMDYLQGDKHHADFK